MEPDTELSWSALEKIHDRFAAVAFEVCATEKSVAPQLLIIDADNEGNVTGFSPLPVEVLSVFFRDTAGKELFAQFIRGLLKKGSKLSDHFFQQAGYYPRVLVQINEAWALITNGTEENAERDALLAGKLSVSEAKQRKDCLSVIVHTPQRSVPVVHLIEELPTRHCVPAKFPEHSLSSYSGGRFSMGELNAKEEGPLH